MRPRECRRLRESRIIIPIPQIRKARPGALRELAQLAGLCGVRPRRLPRQEGSAVPGWMAAGASPPGVPSVRACRCGCVRVRECLRERIVWRLHCSLTRGSLRNQPGPPHPSRSSSHCPQATASPAHPHGLPPPAPGPPRRSGPHALPPAPRGRLRPRWSPPVASRSLTQAPCPLTDPQAACRPPQPDGHAGVSRGGHSGPRARARGG